MGNLQKKEVWIPPSCMQRCKTKHKQDANVLALASSDSDFWPKHEYPSEIFFSYNAPIAPIAEGEEATVSVLVMRMLCLL